MERREVQFENNSHKPVLLYRVAYNDGDEEGKKEILVPSDAYFSDSKCSS